MRHRSERAGAKKGIIVLRLAIACLAIMALVSFFIYNQRTRMNLESHRAMVERRLADYPQILGAFEDITEELLSYLETSDHESMARQAAFMFLHDRAHASESERLAWIQKVLSADSVTLLSEGEASEICGINHEEGFNTVAAPVDQARMIVLKIKLETDYMYDSRYRSVLPALLEAGMNGHVVLLHDDTCMVYPEDERARDIGDMVSGMLDAHVLNPDVLRERAGRAGSGYALQSVRSMATQAFPAGTFILNCAAYADNADFVICLKQVSDLTRRDGTRTWSLILLTLSSFLLMGWCLWQTKLYKSYYSYRKGRLTIWFRCFLFLIFVCVVLVLCVCDIQMLSQVKQNADITSASESFLKGVLPQDEARAEAITAAFDRMGQVRADTAASILSLNPELADIDALKALDGALEGVELQVRDARGVLKTTDGIFQSGAVSERAPDSSAFRAPILDADGRTTGFVDYYADRTLMEDMLKNTLTMSVLNSLHTLEDLQVIQVDKSEQQTIIAGSDSQWIGDLASDHGIETDLLYAGYQGMMTMDGRNEYVCVFEWKDTLIVVASESIHILAFLKSIATLVGGILLLAVLLYTAMIRLMYALQANSQDAEVTNARTEYPSFRIFVSGFMVTLFLLFVGLFVITNGQPTGVSYNMVRGAWIRSLNTVTITAYFMVFSTLYTAYLLLAFLLDRLSLSLSARGFTVCEMVKSAVRYLGTLALIITALSMMGVNTATLVGGVGLVAIIFTMGANTLVADMLAGMFLIFEGHYSIGDRVIIDGFTGNVEEMTIRTTKIRDDTTKNVRIFKNSMIMSLIRESREMTTLSIDLFISPKVGLERGEKILRDVMREMPEKYHQIVGKPRYLGVVAAPKPDDAVTGRMVSLARGFNVRIEVDCLEKKRTSLAILLERELAWVASMLLSDAGQVGLVRCRVLPKPEEGSDQA